MKFQTLISKLAADEAGFVISAELTLVLTIAVLSMVVGLSEVAVAVTTEMNDISNAIGALRQSYGYTGFYGCGGKDKSFVAGSTFVDGADDCDHNTTCQIVVGRSGSATSESGF